MVVDVAISKKSVRAISESMQNEDISTQCTGTNNEFEIKPFQKKTLMVFWNGVLQRIGNEITLLSNSKFRTTFTPESSDSLHVIYFLA